MCTLVMFGFERTPGLPFKIALALDMTLEAPGVFKNDYSDLQSKLTAYPIGKKVQKKELR